jgi:hypothetical protein
MELSKFRRVMLLNNNGVKLLDAGHHEEAISWFKTASKLLSKKLAPELESSANVHVGSPHISDEQHPECLSSPCASTSPRRQTQPTKPTTPSSSQEEKEDDDAIVSPLKRPIVSSDAKPAPSQKRSRSQPTAKPESKAFGGETASSASYVIGRPWWLTEENMRGHSMVSLSSILLYNLALNYHLQGLLDQKPIQKSKLNLNRAMGVYEMAQRLAWKAPSPILLLSLHNMSQIHFHRENHAQGNALSREVCKILRVLHVGIDGYEKYYLRMLSLKSRMLAPAA